MILKYLSKLAKLRPKARVATRLSMMTCFYLSVISQPSLALIGTETNEHPAVGYMLDGNLSSCACTLIAPSVVLTAAHCVSNPIDRTQQFYSGQVEGMCLFKTSNGEEISGSFLRSYSFGSHNKENDVAAVILKQPIPATQIAPMAIASQRPTRGQPATTIGFSTCAAGERVEGSPLIKRKAHLPVGEQRSIHCKGDSGGPYLNSGNEIFAVTSAGSRERPRFTMYYGDVVRFRRQILDIIESESIEAPKRQMRQDVLAKSIETRLQRVESWIGVPDGFNLWLRYFPGENFPAHLGEIGLNRIGDAPLNLKNEILVLGVSPDQQWYYVHAFPEVPSFLSSGQKGWVRAEFAGASTLKPVASPENTEALQVARADYSWKKELEESEKNILYFEQPRVVSMSSEIAIRIRSQPSEDGSNFRIFAPSDNYSIHLLGRSANRHFAFIEIIDSQGTRFLRGWVLAQRPSGPLF